MFFGIWRSSAAICRKSNSLAGISEISKFPATGSYRSPQAYSPSVGSDSRRNLKRQLRLVRKRKSKLARRTRAHFLIGTVFFPRNGFVRIVVFRIFQIVIFWLNLRPKSTFLSSQRFCLSYFTVSQFGRCLSSRNSLPQVKRAERIPPRPGSTITAAFYKNCFLTFLKYCNHIAIASSCLELCFSSASHFSAFPFSYDEDARSAVIVKSCCFLEDLFQEVGSCS